MNLIDASALYDLIIDESMEKLRNAFILDLTHYEFSNAVWKNCIKTKKISKSEAKKLIKKFVILDIKTIRLDFYDLQDIFKIARRYSLTIYDSTYIHYAYKYSLKLITNDDGMKTVWKKFR